LSAADFSSTPFRLALTVLCRPADAEITTDRGKAYARPLSAPTKAIISVIQSIAESRNVSMAQVALAWSLSKPSVSAPIVGTTSLEKLDDLIRGCELELTPEEIGRIDGPYQPVGVMGHQ
jgi:aryl-alcohol dehydrogenase-like predicted oxidoreductase